MVPVILFPSSISLPWNGNLIRKTIPNEIYPTESQTFKRADQDSELIGISSKYLNIACIPANYYYEFNSSHKCMGPPTKCLQNSGSLWEIYRFCLLLMNLSKCHGAHCTTSRADTSRRCCWCVQLSHTHRVLLAFIRISFIWQTAVDWLCVFNAP